MSLHSYDATTKTLTRIAGSTPPVFGFTPVGTVISVMATEAPEFYLKCDGTEYNIADYPELAQHFENQFGSANNFGGDGTTTFAVPDLRGEFLRGTGTNSHENQGNGADVGEHQDGTEHLNNFIANGGGANGFYIPTGTGEFRAKNVDFSGQGDGWNQANASKTAVTHSYGYFTSRPTNTSVLWCIAYQNIHISLDDNRPVQAAMDRWLRFDPDNKKGLIIKAGTSILKSNKHYKTFSRDTKVDFSSTITGTDNGKDFFVYLLDDDSVIASNSKLTAGVEIGRFHTLCADAGAALTMTMPASPSSGINTSMYVQVKPYRIEIDPDFYVFYNKKVTAVSAGTPYDVITCEHPLKGYVAGDILPESVFCKTFYPETLVDDAMVYDKTTDLCVDVYLQSGTGFNTRSVYGGTHTVSREAYNHRADMQTMGKRLLYCLEFISMALGSNECTAIQGASDKTVVGGHVDTAGRRMISAIGVEEACGYIVQWLSDIGFNGQTSFTDIDGRSSFGKINGEPYMLRAGGQWADSTNCGSRCSSSSAKVSSKLTYTGARGCIEITKSANAPKNSLVEAGNNYSTEEKIVGTWIDGKPLYQKTVTANCPNVPTNGSPYVVTTASGISDIDNIVSNEGFTSIGRQLPVVTRVGSIYFYLSANLFKDGSIEVATNWNAFSSSTICYLTFRYTKTTD